MQFAQTIRKVGAFAASALMTGATLGFAADLSNFPSPFVQSGDIDSQIVVGSTAATADVVGGIQIAARLGNLAFTSEQKTVTGVGSPGWNVDGDGQLMATSNDQLFFGSNINAERDTISEGDMNILATTVFEDDNGNTVDIDFDIVVGTNQIKFTNDVGDLDDEDPQLIVDIPDKSVTDVTDATDWLYKVRITFDEAINFSSSVVRTEKLTLFGTEFTISTDSMSNPANSVVLFGGERVFSLGKGEVVTFSDDDGTEHTFELVAVTDGDTVAYRLDGKLESKDEGQTITVSGTDTEVLLDEVVQTNADTSDGVLEIKIGRGKIILQDGQEVQVGADEDDIDGTLVDLEGLSNGEVTGIVVAVAAKATNKDYLTIGQEFADPVFGAFKVVFGGLTPALDSEEREAVELKPSGDRTVTVSFTTDKGDSLTFEWANTETSDLVAGTAINLADSDDDSIIVIEGAQAIEDDYIVADAEFSHIFEVDEIDVSGDTDDDEVIVIDTATGKKVTFDTFTYNSTAGAITGLGNTANGIDADDDLAVAEEVIDGKNYRLIAYGTDASAGADAIRLGWGAGVGTKATIAQQPSFETIYEQLTGANQTSGTVTLFPGVDTVNGGTIAFVGFTNTVNHGAGDTVVYEMPSTESSDDKTVTILLNTTGDTATVTNADSGGASSLTAAPITFVEGAFQYNITAINTTAETFTITVAPLSTASLNINSVPALLFIEEEDDNDLESGFVIFPDADITDDELEVSRTNHVRYFKGTSGTGGVLTTTAPHAFDTLESNDDLEQMVSLFGTLVEVDTDQQGRTSLWYSDEQAVAGVAFLDLDASLVEGGASSVTYDQLTPSGVPDLSLLDSEVTSAVKSNNNLILVGGPAVNSLVAELAAQDGSEVWDREMWNDGAHDNRAQIVLVENAFVSGRAALVVAGHESVDTRAASLAVARYDRAPFSTKATSGTTAIELTSAEYPA